MVQFGAAAVRRRRAVPGAPFRDGRRHGRRVVDGIHRGRRAHHRSKSIENSITLIRA